MSAQPSVGKIATPLVISIQSQVVYGHVGNSAAVLPLQANGINVAAVPTTLLSNNPHYPTMRGRILEASLLADLLLGVEERGLVEAAAIIQTGYLGSVENGGVVADFVRRARERNPALTYLCDPVIGDADLGVFVAPGLEELIRDELVPSAHIITPNQFELGLLAHVEVRTVADVVAAAGATCSRAVATGCTLDDTPDGMVDTVAVEPSAHGASSAWRVTTPRIPVRPAGTGDIFSGLTVARLVRGEGLAAAVAHAVSSTYAVLEATRVAGTAEMCMAACAAALTHPERAFEPARILG